MNSNEYIIAIDLGSASVKVAAGSREPDGKLNVLGAVSLPMEGMIRGEVVNIELVTIAIRDAVKQIEEKLDIRIREAYTGASGQDIRCVENAYFVYITGEDGEIREVDVAKLHESMENLQPPDGIAILDRIPQKYIIDNSEETTHPVGRFGHQLQATFNFVLGNKNTLERMGKAFRRLEINQLATYTNAQASAAAALTDDERELGVAVIDIGAGCSDICIWQDNKLRHVGVIPIGAAAINSDIKASAIPERSIEKLKITYGYAIADRIPEDRKAQSIKIKGRTRKEDKEVSFYNLAQIIEARMLDIIEYAMDDIKDSGYADKLGAGIVLTGGGAMLKDVDTLFREKTKLDVRIGGTEHNLVSSESYEFADDPHLTAVLGILLLGMRESNIQPIADPLGRRSDKTSENGTSGFYDEEDRRQNGNRNTQTGNLTVNERERLRQQKEREEHRRRDMQNDEEWLREQEDRERDGRKRDKTLKRKDKPAKEKKKGGIFAKMKDVFDGVFEVVDDDVIE